MQSGSILTNKRICLTVGLGGVGKTTMAAVLGLQAAVCGKKALVMTIDPAMRLADALGLTSLPSGKHRLIKKSRMQQEGIPARSDLTVTMLDTGRSFRELIRREIPSQKARNRILEHTFFQKLCNDLAGSREYAAMEEILHLDRRGGFDLLVIDTPPSNQALDFLDAPDRILDVLEHGSYRWLMRPALLAGRIGLKILDFSGGYVVRTLTKFTGTPFLAELASFVDLFSGFMEGFHQRASAFKVILRSFECALVLITTPDPNRSDETLALYQKLCARNLIPHTLAVNRYTYPLEPLPDDPEIADQLLTHLGHALQSTKADAKSIFQAMRSSHEIINTKAARDDTHVRWLTGKLEQRSQVQKIPFFPDDIHSLGGLEKIRQAVFEPGAKAC